MKLYNVEMSIKYTIVLLAEDEEDAYEEARYHWRDGLNDGDAMPTFHVTGQVTKASHLREGWDTLCIPYGGDGNTRISKILEEQPK